MANWNGKEDAGATPKKRPQPARNVGRNVQRTLERRYWLTPKGDRYLAEQDRRRELECETGGCADEER